MIWSRSDMQLKDAWYASTRKARAKGWKEIIRQSLKRIFSQSGLWEKTKRPDRCHYNKRAWEPPEQCHQQYPAGQFEHYCSDIICGYWLNTSLSISRLLKFSAPIGLGATFQFFNNPWLCWNRGALINNRKKANLQGSLENAPALPQCLCFPFSMKSLCLTETKVFLPFTSKLENNKCFWCEMQ